MAPPYVQEFEDNFGEKLGASFIPNQPDNADELPASVDVKTTSRYHKLALQHNTLTINTSPPFRQHPLGAVTAHNGGGQAGYGYPANNPQLTWNRLDSQAMACNCIIGTLVDESVISSGDPWLEQLFTFGRQTAAGDEATYDPLNLRAMGPLTTADDNYYEENLYYDKEFVGFGFNASSLQCPGLLRVDISIKGTFSGTTNSASSENNVTFEGRRYDASHNLLNTVRLGSIETGTRNFTKSRTKYFRAYDTTRETWNVDDYWVIAAINATQAWREIELTVREATCVVTWWPSP